MAENIFKKARLKAAETDERFRTAESAALEIDFISRERMYMIEQEDPNKRQIIPTPAEVIEMAQIYNAPELCDHYCTNVCPMGAGRAPLMYSNLGEISAKLMSAMHFLEKTNDQIHAVLADSKVSDSEKADFKRIIQTLREVSYSADSLELWAKKNGYRD